MGCDILDLIDEAGISLISIHAPTWGATNAVYRGANRVNEFQSTHPRGVRHCPRLSKRNVEDFNPRTHVGCDTCKYGRMGIRPDISIHAPTWGATAELIQLWEKPVNFNPRTHVGCDLVRLTLKSLKYISIHAPTWGATKWCITPSKCVNYFNPRTHVGCDKVVVKNILIPCISIHAPTWGATK